MLAPREDRSIRVEQLPKCWAVAEKCEGVCRELRRRDHIYMGRYEGWYCVQDEAYLSSNQVAPGQGTQDSLAAVSVYLGPFLVIFRGGAEDGVMRSVESGHKVEWHALSQ
jgi:hypothetical protein